MPIGLYPKLHCQPTQTRTQVFGRILEQIVNSDRLGDDLHAVSEHWFFERFGISLVPPLPAGGSTDTMSSGRD